MLEDNKQLNKTIEGKNSNTVLSISDTKVFKDNPHVVYLYKKTEKLVSALYLLSSFISDKEPVKWQMREAGVELLSHSLALSDKSSSERMLAYTNFISTGFKFLSYLEVSYQGGIISEMNYNILKYEFESLIQKAESTEKIGGSNGLVFSKQFFEVPAIASNVESNKPGKASLIVNNESLNKTLNTVSDRLSFKKVAKVVHTVEQKQKDKNNRQEIIVSLLKKSNELGIKDITSSFNDCSEKTIQRELATMVSKGLIKKEGEKRWSRYSLR